MNNSEVSITNNIGEKKQEKKKTETVTFTKCFQFKNLELLVQANKWYRHTLFAEQCKCFSTAHVKISFGKYEAENFDSSDQSYDKTIYLKLPSC